MATSSPLRVLMVNENIGGHETVHLHLRRAFADCAEITPVWIEPPAPSLLHRLWRAPIPGLAGLDADLQPLRAQLAVSRSIRPLIEQHLHSVDVVHLYTQNAGLLSSALLGQVPLVVSLDTTNALNAYRLPYREPGIGTPLTVRLTKQFEKRVYDAAEIIVANSEWADRSLRADYEVEPGRIRQFPFGITPPPVATAAPPIDQFRIGFLGRQFLRKGGQVLVEAFTAMANPDARLILISPDPLAAEAARTDPRIEVVADLEPGDPRLWTLLANLSVFAFPSSIDQAPNAVLEAMAAGLPVVGANVAAVPEMIADGVTGSLVEPNDPDALRNALSSLATDPGKAAAMGAAGAKRFADRYTASAGAKRLVDVFHEAVARHDSGGHR